MYFSREDILKIQKALIQLSIKDSEMPEAYTPFNIDDTISIVQKGYNKKISVKEFIDQLQYIKKEDDFVNIVDTYDESYITLEEAIQLIPEVKRKKGLVITFQDTGGNWQMYQFRGELNQWNIAGAWKDLYDFDEYIVNSVLPDEEDLTKVLADSKGNYVSKLKDRAYDPENFSGLGRVILRKNIVEVEDPEYGMVKKNILYQDMLTQSNIIYEIRYDFDLNGQEITIPENCVLEFDGGSLSNGTITYINTILKGFTKNCFNNIECLGTCANSSLKVGYYGDDDTKALNTIFDVYQQKDINIILDHDIILTGNVTIKNNSQLSHYISISGIDKNVIYTKGYSFLGNIDETNGNFPGNIIFNNITFSAESYLGSLFLTNTLIRLRFNNCNFVGYNIVFDSNNQQDYIMQSLYINNCYFRFNNHCLISQKKVFDLRIINCLVEACESFVTAYNCNGVYIIGNCIEGLSKNPITISISATSLIISDNYFEDNLKSGGDSEIYFYGINSNIIKACIERNYIVSINDTAKPVIKIGDSGAILQENSNIKVEGNTINPINDRPFYECSENVFGYIYDNNNTYKVSGGGYKLPKGFLSIPGGRGYTIGGILGDDGYSNYITHPVHGRTPLLSNFSMNDGTSLNSGDFEAVNIGDFGLVIHCTNSAVVNSLKGKSFKFTIQLVD